MPYGPVSPFGGILARSQETRRFAAKSTSTIPIARVAMGTTRSNTVWNTCALGAVAPNWTRSTSRTMSRTFAFRSGLSWRERT